MIRFDNPQEYHTRKPFPYLTGRFTDEDLLKKVVSEFPDIVGTPYAERTFSNQNEKKSVSRKLSESAKKVMEFCYSAEFMDELSKITGIPFLLPDPDLVGGGYHAHGPGGVLGMHTDFNRLPDGPYRRLNVLIYLNDGWRQEWGGQLVLRKNGEEVQINPFFGVVALLRVSNGCFHGVPNVIRCPAGNARKSLAFYYYSKTSASGNDEPFVDTVFKKREEI